MGEPILSETLPAVRVVPQMKAELEAVAERSVSARLSDHIRMAVQEYIDRHLDEPVVDQEYANPVSP